MFPAGLYNMGGDPVTVIEDIRDLLDIGRDRKNPREDYLGEWPTWDPAPSNPHPSGPDSRSLLLSLRCVCVRGRASGGLCEHQCLGFQKEQ